MNKEHDSLDYQWHTIELGILLDKLKSSESGLTKDEAESRLAEYGPNLLPRKAPPTRLEIFLRQFKSPLIVVLIVAAIVSYMIGEVTDSAFITAVLVLNAVIGGVQEWKAEQSALALQKFLQIQATVEREDDICEIDAEKIVPGDVVWVESGNRVAADIRLLMTHGLEVDESLLTGESIPVLKDALARCEPETPVADRINMLHAGATVIRGRGQNWSWKREPGPISVALLWMF